MLGIPSCATRHMSEVTTMPATVFEQHYRDRMQSVRQIALHSDADQARGMGPVFFDLVALCSDLAEAGEQLLELEYKRLFQQPDLTVAWLQERRRVIEELSN